MAKFSGSAANQQYQFRNVNGKRLKGGFSGGDISPDSGVLLLLNLERTVRMIHGAAESIRDMRIPALVKHTAYSILLQRILLIALGYEDAVDSNFMRKDAAIKVALSKSLLDKEYGASQPTVCRFENAVSGQDCYRLAEFMLFFYIMQHKSPKEIILDFDGSCIEAHGTQQLSLLRGHYEVNMYFPLLVFDQDGWLITAVLRPGNHGESRVALPVLRRIVARFRAAWPNVRLIFRADAAFNSPAIYDWCEDNSVFYVIGLKSNHGLNVCAADYASKACKAFRRKHGVEQFVCNDWRKSKSEVLKAIKALPKTERQRQLKDLQERTVRMVGEFQYQARSWRQERRIVVVCDYSDRGLERRFIITNLKCAFADVVHKQYYCKRGRAEQFIKEMKSFKCTRLSCQEFYANQFRLLMHGLAYLLVFQLRERLSERWKKSSLLTVRQMFLKVAAQIEETARCIVVRWTSSYAWKSDFLRVYKLLDSLPAAA